MALYFSSLNSGSNGNCYYVGNNSEAVLVDTGISCRETEKRMARSGLSLTKVKAIFISHEHSDHTYGAPLISKKYGIPVYISDLAFSNSKLELDQSLRRPLLDNSTIDIGALSIKTFSKKHDTVDPFSFTVSENEIKVGVFTDIGSVCKSLEDNFKGCRAAFLEANYDEEMLINGKYPWFLKNRIRGDLGHLSNQQALDLFLKYNSPEMSYLLLSHLSKDNNSPDLALNLFNKHAGKTIVSVASRYEESPVFSVMNA